MIITVTPNVAVDKTLTVPNFQVGFRHRASESLTLPGGKGLNIARALKALGQPVVVTGLVGGRAGQLVTGIVRMGVGGFGPGGCADHRGGRRGPPPAAPVRLSPSG